MRLRSMLVSCLLCLSWTGAYALPAAAQTRPGVTERTAARSLYDQGRRAAEERRWEEARNAWQASHDLVPNPLVLVSLAGAQSQTGHLVDARDNYQRFLLQIDAQTQHFEAHVRAQMADLEAAIAHLSLRDIPRDGAATLDGVAVAPALLTTDIPLDPGLHELALTAQGYEPYRTSLTLARGQHLELAWPALPVVAEPRVESAATRPGPAVLPPVRLARALTIPDGAATQRTRANELRRRRVIWGSVGAVTVVALATGLVVGLLRRDRGTEANPMGPVITTPGNAIRLPLLR